MKAKLEILSGIIRVGPDMVAYDSPYDFAVAFSTNEGVAMLKGLVASTRFSLRHAAAVRKELLGHGLSLSFLRNK